MISYELALKLKEAGYISERNYGYEELTPLDCRPSLELSVEHEKHAVISPTLSELIEACGDEIVNLHRYPFGAWEALGGKIEGKPVLSGSADSPEEAVANLWLELNKI